MTRHLFASKWRSVVPLFVVVGLFFFVPTADAAGLVQCGLSDPWSCQFCDLITLVNNIVKYIVATAMVLAAVLFAYAGYLFFSSNGSEEKIGKAKNIFKDVIIGFVVALLGFTIVNTLLQTLASGYLAPPSWNVVACVANRYFGGGFADPPTRNAGTYGTSNAGSGTPVNQTVLTGDCATGNIPQPSSGAWSADRTKIMACIAQAESSCNPSNFYRGSANSNATGLYQMIIGGYNDPGHNLNFASCSAAVGVTGNLNCYQAWLAGGKALHSPQLATCEQAAKNAQCNTDAANYLLQDACSRGNCYQPWADTAPGCVK